jgi:hypothetical protein
MIPKMSLYKMKNLFEDDSIYPTISHTKKCSVPNVNVLDCVVDFFEVFYSCTNDTCLEN